MSDHDFNEIQLSHIMNHWLIDWNRSLHNHNRHLLSIDRNINNDMPYGSIVVKDDMIP